MKSICASKVYPVSRRPSSTSTDGRDEFRANSDAHSRGSSSRIELACRATRASSPTTASAFSNPRSSLTKISDAVYEIQAAATAPSHEIVFFHGFELGDSIELYRKDWSSVNGSQCWLETWLVEEFPEARILSVSYDSSLVQTSSIGRMDLHKIVENVRRELITAAKVGQRNCPVVLVGHSLGGIVMKSLVVESSRELGEDKSVFTTFVRSVRGLFFYATPHAGSFFVGKERESLTGPLAQNMVVLEDETSRLREVFRALVSKYNWKLFGVGEKNVTKLGKFCGVLVPEGSARQDMGLNYATIDADHFGICKPSHKNGNSFQYLVQFIRKVSRANIHTVQGLPDHPLELDGHVRGVEEKMKKAQVVGIFGMGGIGKTTLARALFNHISVRYEFTCFIPYVREIKLEKLEQRILGLFLSTRRDSGLQDLVERSRK